MGEERQDRRKNGDFSNQIFKSPRKCSGPSGLKKRNKKMVVWYLLFGSRTVERERERENLYTLLPIPLKLDPTTRNISCDPMGTKYLRDQTTHKT